jgi:hypothetical protein
MSNFSHRTKTCAVLLASVLVNLSALAQMGGPGGPAGMSAAISKLFGDIKAFTAKAQVQVLDNSQKEIVSMPMEFALLDKNIRVDMDMTKMKNAQMPPGVADQLKQMGMSHVVSVINPTRKSALIIYPDQKASMTLPMSKEYAEASKTPKMEKTALGKETLDGHPCVKNKVVITDELGEPVEAFTWNATDLKDFPIQIQTKEKEATSIVKFSQVQFVAPEASLFESPAGYTQYKDQQELMQGVMSKFMKGQAGDKK